MRASWSGNKEMVDLLLKYNAQVGLQNEVNEMQTWNSDLQNIPETANDTSFIFQFVERIDCHDAGILLQSCRSGQCAAKSSCTSRFAGQCRWHAWLIMRLSYIDLGCYLCCFCVISEFLLKYVDDNIYDYLLGRKDCADEGVKVVRKWLKCCWPLMRERICRTT